MPTEEEDLPGTLQRSPEEAQRTYQKALDSALKHRFEKSATTGSPRVTRCPPTEAIFRKQD